jgi:hypothetical protein
MHKFTFFLDKAALPGDLPRRCLQPIEQTRQKPVPANAPEIPPSAGPQCDASMTGLFTFLSTPLVYKQKMPFRGKGYERNREASDQLEKITL